jgi:anti-sigma factor RsiW
MMETDRCNESLSLITLHLDDELRGDDLSAFESHLEACERCRAALANQRRFLDSIRATRPVYPAPDGLRRRSIEILDEARPALRAPDRLRRAVNRLVTGNISGAVTYGRRRLFAVSTVLAAALLLSLSVIGVLWSKTRRPPTPVLHSDFAMMAVDTHLRHQRGQLPFEITSDSPDEISAWFKGKVSFGVQLPNYQEASGQEKLYSLNGARLVAFHNDYAAYVAYEMKNQPISLVMTSDQTAEPYGGDEIVSKGITFHFDSIEGLKVITWSDRGLTYALVSELDERGQQSCMVCHAGTKDRDFIEKLRTQLKKPANQEESRHQEIARDGWRLRPVPAR